MCDFPSWLEKDGEALFLTDDDIIAWHETNRQGQSINWHDFVGHSGIIKILGDNGGEHKELFPIHPDIAKAIREGKMDKMMRLGGWANLNLDNDTVLLEQFRHDEATIRLRMIGDPSQEAQVERFRYRSNRLEYHFHVKNNKLHGLHEEFYFSGEIKIRRNYENGSIVFVEVFYPDGTLEKSGTIEEVGTQYLYWL